MMHFDKARAMRVSAVRVALGCAVVALALVFGGCYFGALGSGGTAQAALSVAMKQPAAAVTSVAVIVTGPDMAPITRTLSPTTSELTLDVPAGSSRTFRVLVNTPSVTFAGEATVDLEPGETTTVSLAPELYATQILVPDGDNYRLVQIANMTGMGWASRSGTQIGFTNDWELYPYDIDFDAEGRIYVANDNYSFGVIRLDDITDPSYESIVIDTAGMIAIAIDRPNAILYCASFSAVYQVVLESGPPFAAVDLNLSADTGFLNPVGLAVDAAGLLYIADTYTTPRVLKVDLGRPSGSRLLSTYSANLESPWDGFDVVVKDPYVYVASYDAPTGYMLQQLDMNLAYVDSFGYPTNPPEAPATGDGEFYGPRRFVAILNRKLYLIDQAAGSLAVAPYSAYSYDRLVAFEDASGSAWETYGSSGSGQGQFSFPFASAC